MMLPVGVVLCMLGQQRLSPPLAAIIAGRCSGMLATNCCRRSTRISAHSANKAWQSSPCFWGGLSILVVAWPNSSQIYSVWVQSADLAGCSILVMLLCWRKLMTTETCEVWRYRLGSGSYSPNTAWQMAQSCNLDSSPKMNAAIGPLLSSATCLPTPSRYGGAWQLTGADLWVYRHSNHGTTASCWFFLVSPHSIQFPPPRRQGPSTYEATLLDHHQQSMVLTRWGLPGNPHELAWH